MARWRRLSTRARRNDVAVAIVPTHLALAGGISTVRPMPIPWLSGSTDFLRINATSIFSAVTMWRSTEATAPEPDAAKAEGYFDRALTVARQQQAKSRKLRAAISLASLWRSQGKPQQARELLAPICGWFTEGFDTRDLRGEGAAGGVGGVRETCLRRRCPISDCFAATVLALQISGTVRDTPPDLDRLPRTFRVPLRRARLTDCCIDTWPAVQRVGEPLRPCRGLGTSSSCERGRSYTGR